MADCNTCPSGSTCKNDKESCTIENNSINRIKHVIGIMSGNGGAGKTTIAIALAELAKDVVKVDCDVDAPNLYLFNKGIDVNKEDFIAGKKVVLNKELCKNVE